MQQPTAATRRCGGDARSNDAAPVDAWASSGASLIFICRRDPHQHSLAWTPSGPVLGSGSVAAAGGLGGGNGALPRSASGVLLRLLGGSSGGGGGSGGVGLPPLGRSSSGGPGVGLGLGLLGPGRGSKQA
ncbi:hypothetical protein CHLRE_02g112433v5 [Chlamydomonas reinhardtii]|uniref:Uncharacterized protein n=1 Tax=Chlamydomonas reinhardtii TaxID=3055 RepID=A0A2K3E317_CHLRE|nr:uncharacterized protein CHLRE_02g112433v5 [Chlamydomonas reinhardtii]XP_042927544.1 uncharacterized protein CHLRE_02g112433v5 [Chlamydomonas reinhardtii]PNW87188.1 hypothetical protein CHLRE_02g112433v5 [Chlamydomonas reinhardtii]PNW87189.1 hypothetical protein CHLRE_02g112433v5 [Chlamydomonas reinhardtii]